MSCFSFLLVMCLLGFINSSNPNVLIIYPLLFIFLSILTANKEQDFSLLSLPIKLNIIYGLLSMALAMIGIHTSGCINQLGRGFVFIPGPLGFGSTIQVFGTLCISLILILIATKQSRSPWMYVACFAIIVSLNRASIIFLYLILLLYRPKTALIIAIGMMVVIMIVEPIQDFLFSASTLNSRQELRQGAQLSYWSSHDPLIILFGKGTHLTSDSIAYKTIWERRYIENGIDFLFHSYGCVGFVLYLGFIGYVCIRTLKIKAWRLCIMALYYLTIVQTLTNEFLSSSFCFFMSTILMLAKRHSIQCHHHEKIIDYPSFG